MASQPFPAVAVREYQVDSDAIGATRLSDTEIHVWHQSLALGIPEVETLRRLLSPDELRRAERFRFEPNRKEFIVCRGTLRRLLGSYLQVPAAELRFAYSEYGRPSLMADTKETKLDFNVSHSGEAALLAFGCGRTIGIDVEEVRRDFGTSEIAERFFSRAERAALRELSPDQRYEAFFRCWTRKEAFIKALGEGLSHPLDQFDVSLAPGAPAALLATRPDAQEVNRWKLWDIEVPSGYAAALAAKSNGKSIRPGYPGIRNSQEYLQS